MYTQKTKTQADQGQQEEEQPQVLLGHVVLSCVGALLFANPEVKPVGAEQVYLHRHFQFMHQVTDLDGLVTRLLARPAPTDKLVVFLAETLGFSHLEILTLTLALMVEENPMVGRSLAHVQAPVGGSRPCLGLLEAALAPFKAQDEWVAGNILSGPALASQTLQLVNQQAPIPEQMVQVPQGLALLLRGKPLLWPGCRDLEPERGLRLPPSIIDTARHQAKALTRGEHGVLVIRSASRDEARAVAVQVANQFESRGMLIPLSGDNLQGLGVACGLGKRVPVLEYELGTQGDVLVPEFPGYQGPRLVLTGPEGQVTSRQGSISQWTLNPPSRQERQQLWSDYLQQEELAEQLAREYVHSSGRIAELAHLAGHQARLQQREQPVISDIRSAAWEADSGLLSSLAQPVADHIPDQALVLSKAVHEELRQLLARCRAREHLGQRLGITIKARYQQGVRCLMTGPSGTGKTLVAGWLATKLGLPLYRVDLAAVVSKYIGETEKNLATLLARAEHSEIMLLFDEADSLFGKRTEVKDSNDRFANSQTNYLLQRIEYYRGIVLLTSNSRERFDSAFTRRLDKIVEFSLPNPQERRALWHCHLGSGHQLLTNQINHLATVCDLSGGDIRNAVLTAAVEADAAGRPIDFQDVVVGLVSEYRKLGRQFPAELRRNDRG
ncbi:MAG: ATP-binding protein [Desulfovermiculus sp.]